MLFLNQNFLSTITMITLSANAGGTATIGNLFDNKKSTQYSSQGVADDLSTLSVTIDFGVTTTLSNIVLRNHNLKNFSITYSATAFSPAVSATNNSSADLYFSFNTVNVSVLTLTATETIVANEEKKIGEFIPTKLLYDFSTNRLPTAKQYKPDLFKKQVIHKMSDGGITLYNIADKFKAQIGFTFLPTSSASILKTIYESNEPFNFLPWETTASWDGDIYECNWMKGFGLLAFSDNNLNNGYKGKIMIQETAGR